MYSTDYFSSVDPFVEEEQMPKVEFTEHVDDDEGTEVEIPEKEVNVSFCQQFPTKVRKNDQKILYKVMEVSVSSGQRFSDQNGQNSIQRAFYRRATVLFAAARRATCTWASIRAGRAPFSTSERFAVYV